MESAWTMKVPLNRENTEHAIFELKEMDIDLFMAVKSLLDKSKYQEAILMVINTLKVGGDDPAKIKGNFIAFQSAMELVTQLLEPVPGELKKN